MNEPKFEVNEKDMVLTALISISENRLSKTGKSIVRFHSGHKFTQIPGTNLFYKFVVIQLTDSPLIESSEDKNESN